MRTKPAAVRRALGQIRNAVAAYHAARRAESTAASVDASVPPFSSRQQARAQQIPILARIEPAPKGLRYQQKVGPPSETTQYHVLTISRLVESLMPRCALISSRYEARGSVPVSTSVQKRETRKVRKRDRDIEKRERE